jgi:NitT/TauT family transport system permease protein
MWAKTKSLFINSIPFIVILTLWELLGQLGIVKPLFLPTFSKVLVALYDFTVSGKLFFHFTRTIYRMAVGYFSSVVFAILFGLAIGLSKPMRQFFTPLIAATYPLPKVSLLSLFIVWLGLGNPPIIAIIFASASYPILLNTITGILQVDKTLIKAAENLGANHRQVLMKVVFPGAIPIIFGGLRIGVAVSLIVVVAIEMYIANDGIGYLLAWATEFHLMELLFSLLIVIGVFGILLFKGLDLCESILIPWKK